MLATCPHVHGTRLRNHTSDRIHCSRPLLSVPDERLGKEGHWGRIYSHKEVAETGQLSGVCVHLPAFYQYLLQSSPTKTHPQAACTGEAVQFIEMGCYFELK